MSSMKAEKIRELKNRLDACDFKPRGQPIEEMFLELHSFIDALLTILTEEGGDASKTNSQSTEAGNNKGE